MLTNCLQIEDKSTASFASVLCFVSFLSYSTPEFVYIFLCLESDSTWTHINLCSERNTDNIISIQERRRKKIKVLKC